MSIKDLYGRASARLAQTRQIGSKPKSLIGRYWLPTPAALPRDICWGFWQRRPGRGDEALEQIAAALKINPGDSGALVNYANVLSLKGRLAEAWPRAMSVLLAIRPDADVFKGPGSRLAGPWTIEEALACYRQALAS